VSTPIPPAPPTPAAIEPEAAGRGCLKKSLIGCGVVALVCAVGFIAFFIYVRQRPETITDAVMSQVESHYAADVTAEEKEQLHKAYADFRTALKEHRVSREPLDRMRTTLVSGGAQSEVSRKQVRDLTELFRRAASSRAAPATPGGPAPSPRPTP
jgi:hypothetical protein